VVRGVHETVCWQLTSMPRSCWNTLAKVFCKLGAVPLGLEMNYIILHPDISQLWPFRALCASSVRWSNPWW